jgi:ribonuclease HII
VLLPCLHHRAYADSKTLTEAQREGLYQQVRAEPQLAALRDSLSAAALSAAALGRSRVSLNELAARSTCGLIQRALDAGVALRKVRGWGPGWGWGEGLCPP